MLLSSKVKNASSFLRTLMKRQIEFMRGSRGIGSKRTDSRTEKNRIYEEEEENGKMLERFSDELFSRLFNKLLLCSTILPLELRTSNRREGRKEETRARNTANLRISSP